MRACMVVNIWNSLTSDRLRREVAVNAKNRARVLLITALTLAATGSAAPTAHATFPGAQRADHFPHG